MKVGVLKEGGKSRRVAMLPEAVKALEKIKVELLVESGAGENASATDSDYKEAGATVLKRADLIKQADVIISINTPEKLSEFPAKKVLITTAQPLNHPKTVTELLSKDITCFSLDSIPRTTRAQAMDVLSSMATVAGYKAVLLAAANAPKFFPMFMTAAGTIKPAKVLILGAGVAGLQAIATAKRLGGVVEVFDVRAAVKEEVQSLGAKFVEVEGATDSAAAGGYAVEQTEEFKQKQQQVIQDHAIASDIIICTAQIPGREAPKLILKSTVESMQAGSVIVDLAASSGGNCELSENEKTIVKNGVTIIGDSNLPDSMPIDASRMYGQNVINFLKLIVNEEGKLNLNFEDELVTGTCISHNKEILNERVKDSMLAKA